MKRLVFASLLLLSCNRNSMTNQQKAERLVEEYIHISDNQEAIKKIKFTELNTSNVIGVIENKLIYDNNHHPIHIRTVYYSLNKNLIHVNFIYTN
jgi:hypothetical protein